MMMLAKSSHAETSTETGLKNWKYILYVVKYLSYLGNLWKYRRCPRIGEKRDRNEKEYNFIINYFMVKKNTCSRSKNRIRGVLHESIFEANDQSSIYPISYQLYLYRKLCHIALPLAASISRTPSSTLYQKPSGSTNTGKNVKWIK